MRAFGITKVVVFYALVAAVGLFALLARGGAPWPASISHGLFCVVIGLGVGLGLVAVSRALSERFAWGQRLAAELRCALGELSAKEALILAFWSALAEELLFRGVLQPALGLWIAALVFGVLHTGPNRNFLPWTLMACAVGLLFGFLFAATGNLVAPMVAHFVVNYLNLKHLCAPRRGVHIHGWQNSSIAHIL